MSTPDFYHTSEHLCLGRGTKSVKCKICRGKIEKGQKYTAISGKWEGDFDAFNVHSACMKIMDDCCGYCVSTLGFHDDETPPFTELVDFAREDFHNGGGKPLEYWPEGVPVTYEGLREHVKASAAARRGTEPVAEAA